MTKSKPTNDLFSKSSDIIIVSVMSILLLRGLRMGTKFHIRLDVSTLFFPFSNCSFCDGFRALTYVATVCLIKYLSAFDLLYREPSL
jgi:hypothetical protein